MSKERNSEINLLNFNLENQILLEKLAKGHVHLIVQIKMLKVPLLNQDCLSNLELWIKYAALARVLITSYFGFFIKKMMRLHYFLVTSSFTAGNPLASGSLASIGVNRNRDLK